MSCNTKNCFFDSCMEKAQSLNPDLNDSYSSILSLDGVTDDKGMCIFHSNDNIWRSNNLPVDFFRNYIEMCLTIENIKNVVIKDAFIGKSKGENAINLNGIAFTKPITIISSTFETDVYFRQCHFSLIDFYNIHFNGQAYFEQSVFNSQARINDCHFHKDARFNKAIFRNGDRGNQYASFNKCIFYEQANFPEMHFSGASVHANFQDIEFKKTVYFSNSRFDGHFLFDGTKSETKCDFTGCTFRKNAFWAPRNDNPVRFNIADFTGATFLGTTNFLQCSIRQGIFDNLDNQGLFNFKNSTFDDISFNALTVGENGLLYFEGALDNPVFNGNVAFEIDPSAIHGRIKFKSVSLRNILPAQLKALKKLEATGNVEIGQECKVYFEKEVIQFKKGFSSSIIADTLCLHWKRWLREFTDDKKIELHFRSDDDSNLITVILAWRSNTDFKLIYNLTVYFFEYIIANSEGFFEVIKQRVLNDSLIEKVFLDDIKMEKFSTILSYALKAIVDAVNSDYKVSQKATHSNSQGELAKVKAYLSEMHLPLKAILQILEYAGKNRNIIHNYINMGNQLNIGKNASGQFQISFGNNIEMSQVVDNHGGEEKFKHLSEEVKMLIERLSLVELKVDNQQEQIDLLAEVLKAAEAKDKDSLLQKVMKIAPWLIDFAKSVGSDVIANKLAGYF